MNYLNIELNGIDDNGNEKLFKLSDFKGKNLIVYFYPQDDTPVCTQEAVNFKEAMNKLKNYAEIIGVSADEIKDHLEFKAKYNLNFILLSDKLNKLKNAFKESFDKHSDIHRSTFILDKNGNIVKIWEKVDVNDHIEEIMNFFQKNQNS